jgi:hypothetical protein
MGTNSLASERHRLQQAAMDWSVVPCQVGQSASDRAGGWHDENYRILQTPCATNAVSANPGVLLKRRNPSLADSLVFTAAGRSNSLTNARPSTQKPKVISLISALQISVCKSKPQASTFQDNVGRVPALAPSWGKLPLFIGTSSDELGRSTR